MNYLIGVASTRTINAPYNRIAALQQRWGCDVQIERDGGELLSTPYPNPARYNNATEKFERLRVAALEGAYDGLLLVDDDQLIPVDQMDALLDVDADVVWGMTVWRGRLRRWSACVYSAPHGANVMLDQLPHYARAVWGQVVDVVGHGNFCTLIRPAALRASRFWRPSQDLSHDRGPRYPGGDWYFSRGCLRAGLRMKCHTGVLVGHIEQSEISSLWPVLRDGVTPTHESRSFCDEHRHHTWF